MHIRKEEGGGVRVRVRVSVRVWGVRESVRGVRESVRGVRERVRGVRERVKVRVGLIVDSLHCLLTFAGGFGVVQG